MAKIAVALACMLCFGVANADPTQALLKENAIQLLDVQDDAMETDITITSYKVWQQRSTRPDLSVSDALLRVWINKRTKMITAQVVYLARYRAQDAWRLNVGNYESPNGPVAADAVRISLKVDSCDQYMGCYYTEQVGFSVPWPVVQFYAERYTPEKRQDWWKLRIKGQSSEAIDIGIPLGELAAVVERATALSKN
jgi:hypothetical protein